MMFIAVIIENQMVDENLGLFFGKTAKEAFSSAKSVYEDDPGIHANIRVLEVSSIYHPEFAEPKLVKRDAPKDHTIL